MHKFKKKGTSTYQKKYKKKNFKGRFVLVSGSVNCEISRSVLRQKKKRHTLFLVGVPLSCLA